MIPEIVKVIADANIKIQTAPSVLYVGGVLLVNLKDYFLCKQLIETYFTYTLSASAHVRSLPQYYIRKALQDPLLQGIST